MVFFLTRRGSLLADLHERMVFQTPVRQGIISGPPLQLAFAAVQAELEQTSNRSGSIVVVGLRSKAIEAGIKLSPDESVGTGTCQALGIIGSVMVQPENKVCGGVLALQAGSGHPPDTHY
jgi:hypothetical protein